MKFKNYTLKSFIDSFDIVWSCDDIVVIQDEESTMVAFPITTDLVALYVWNDFPDLTEDERKEEAVSKMEETKHIVQSTIQVVNDMFPKTNREEVACIIKRHSNALPFNVNESLLVSDTNIVKIYTNPSKDNWWLFVLNQMFCSLDNYKSALRIAQLIDADCRSIIGFRWR